MFYDEIIDHKDLYDERDWKAGKERQDKVVRWIGRNVPGVVVKTYGFGADTTERLEGHGDEPGEPDLEILDAETGERICWGESTGTEKVKNPDDYWVGKHKIDWAQDHKDTPYWTFNVYGDSEEPIFIHPDQDKGYPSSVKWPRNVPEQMVVFDRNSSEVKSGQEFVGFVAERKRELRRLKLDRLLSGIPDIESA